MKHLHKTPLNSLKFEAAKKYCEGRGLVFEVVDVEVDFDLIEENLNAIKFSGNYEERFKKYDRA